MPLLPLLMLLIMTGCASYPYPFRVDKTHEKYLATAQRPISTGYPVTTQHNMLSMHHWDVLADKVASQGSQAIESFLSDQPIGVYVAQSGATPFAKTYREALITHFLGYGVPIADTPEGNVVLEVKTEILTPKVSNFSKYAKTRKTVEPEFSQNKDENGWYKRIPVISEDNGYFGDEAGKAEMQVNTSLIYGSNYLFRDSSIFYIDRNQLRNYQPQTAPANDGDAILKRYSLVNK